VLLLTGGAVVTVAVAWRHSWDAYAPVRIPEATRPISDERLAAELSEAQSAAIDAAIDAELDRQLAAIDAGSYRSPETKPQPSGNTAALQPLIAETQRRAGTTVSYAGWDRRWWISMPDDTETRTIHFRAGWPLAALQSTNRAWRHYHQQPDGLWGWTEWRDESGSALARGIALPQGWSACRASAGRLPIAPIPAGFALNTLVYAAGLAVLLVAAFGARDLCRWLGGGARSALGQGSERVARTQALGLGIILAAVTLGGLLSRHVEWAAAIPIALAVAVGTWLAGVPLFRSHNQRR
jgi:hypothetical protein